jgi:hypothetical protein
MVLLHDIPSMIDINVLLRELWLIHCDVPSLTSAFTTPFHSSSVFFEGVTRGEFEAIIARFPVLNGIPFTEIDGRAGASTFYMISRMLPLRMLRIVKLTRPPFEKAPAQIIECNIKTHTVLVRVQPRIDYTNMKRYKCRTQTELNRLMPPGYSPEPAKFNAAAVKGPIKRYIIPWRSQNEIVYLKCKIWDGKTFYGSMQLLEVNIGEVTLKRKIATKVSKIFSVFPLPLKRKERPPVPKVIAPKFTGKRSGPVVAGGAAVVCHGPHKGLEVHVVDITGAVVKGLILPREICGSLKDFTYPESGCCSLPVPRLFISASLDYPQGTLIRLTDDGVGVVTGHNDDDVLVFIHNNTICCVDRSGIAERLPREGICSDRAGLRITVGDTVALETPNAERRGVILYVAGCWVFL